MMGSSVDESVEFFMVNLTWVLSVNSLSSLSNPTPLIGGKGVIKGCSDLLNTVFHFFVVEGSAMVGIKIIEGIISLFVVNTWFWASLFFSVFSSEFAEIPMMGSSVDESVEFFMVNITWVLAVNSLSSLSNPTPLIGGKGVIKGCSDLLNTVFHFFVVEGSAMVGIKIIEGIISLFVVNTLISATLFPIFSSEFAEIPMSDSSVDESVEFFMVNMTWVLCVNSLSSLFNPSPLIGGKGVIKGCSDMFNTDFNFIVGEGSAIVGIKSIEGMIGLYVVNTLLVFLSLFSSEFAEMEMMGSSVGEFVEFFTVNNSWGF